MITAVTKENWIHTHIVEVSPRPETKMFLKTRCDQLAHVSACDRREVESEDEIRQLCEECEST